MSNTIAFIGPYAFDSVMVDKTIHLVFADLRNCLPEDDRLFLLTGRQGAECVAPAFADYGVRLETVDALRPNGFARLRFWRAGVRLARREQVRLLTNLWGGLSYGFDAIVIARCTGKRCVVRIAGDEIHTRRRLGCYRGWRGRAVWAVDHLRQWLTVNLADAVIVMSPWEKRRVERLVLTKTEVVVCPRGVDTERFRSPSSASPTKNGKLKVLYIGRRSAEKGFDLVAQTAQQLETRQPNIEFLFAGDFEPGAQGNQRFLGFVKPHDLPQLYNSVDVVVLPSHTEGFPQVVAEAMAHGKPCIVSRHLFEGYFQDGREALLCELNPADIAAKIELLYDQPELAARIGAEARVFAVNRLDQRIWKEVYHCLLAGADSPDVIPAAPKTSSRAA